MDVPKIGMHLRCDVLVHDGFHDLACAVYLVRLDDVFGNYGRPLVFQANPSRLVANVGHQGVVVDFQAPRGKHFPRCFCCVLVGLEELSLSRHAISLIQPVPLQQHLEFAFWILWEPFR